MSAVDLTREWLAIPDIGRGDRQLLEQQGVTREAAHRAGGLAVARIETIGRLWTPSPTGVPAFVVPVWIGAAPSIYCGVENPLLVDMLAWFADDPTRWWYRTGEGAALGADNLDRAHVEGWPISFATSPLDWLRGDCRGACLPAYCEGWGVSA